MQFSIANDVKIYNLSVGKSLPEWLSDRKRRKLEQKNIDLRRRVQLIQDFDMPDVSNTINISCDGQYIFASGTYKPTLKCYDTHDLSLKFARGLDSDVIKMLILSEDYSKFILLEDERFLEFHAAYGRHFRMRIPKFGRDMALHRESSDLYIVGSGPDIYRLNLEQGRFLTPLNTNFPSSTCCAFNPEHQLFVCGSSQGHLEAWDPRIRNRVAQLDCTLSVLDAIEQIDGVPGISSLKYRDALQLAVGTNTGQVHIELALFQVPQQCMQYNNAYNKHHIEYTAILLYDLRCYRPLLVKDHQNGLPIKTVSYSSADDLVLSMDSRVVKLWNNTTGCPYAAIEPDSDLNDMAVYPHSGLLFFATEAPKMLQYFVPNLGPAPKWCSYLEAITEELEESDQPAVYDDYKFLTSLELAELGLAHLIGTSLLRAYMHGYFIDVKLYNKARTFTRPFAYDDYKRRKIREQLDEERGVVKKTTICSGPAVNKALAERLGLDEEDEKTADGNRSRNRSKRSSRHKEKPTTSLLFDSRFSSLFTNPEFQVDETSEQYQLLNPAIRKLDKTKKKKRQQSLMEQKFAKVNVAGLDDDEPEGRRSSSESEHSFENYSSSEDDREFIQDLRKTHKELRTKSKKHTSDSHSNSTVLNKSTTVKVFELRSGEDLHDCNVDGSARKLGERVGKLSATSEFGGKTMSFKTTNKSAVVDEKDKMAGHIRERRKARRCAAKIKTRDRGRF